MKALPQTAAACAAVRITGPIRKKSVLRDPSVHKSQPPNVLTIRISSDRRLLSLLSYSLRLYKCKQQILKRIFQRNEFGLKLMPFLLLHNRGKRQGANQTKTNNGIGSKLIFKSLFGTHDDTSAQVQHSSFKERSSEMPFANQESFSFVMQALQFYFATKIEVS